MRFTQILANIYWMAMVLPFVEYTVICSLQYLYVINNVFTASASNIVPTVCNGREVVDSTTSSLWETGFLFVCQMQYTDQSYLHKSWNQVFANVEEAIQNTECLLCCSQRAVSTISHFVSLSD